MTGCAMRFLWSANTLPSAYYNHKMRRISHSRLISLLSRTHPSAVKEHLCGIRPSDATFENDILWCSFGNKEWITSYYDAFLGIKSGALEAHLYEQYLTLVSKFNVFENIRLAEVQTRELRSDTKLSYKLTQNRMVLRREVNWIIYHI